MKDQKQEKPMNVYQKIQKVRSELVKLNLKKTGRNTYSQYTYYELGDFLPALNKLMDDNGLMTRFVIQSKNGNSPEKAVLEVFNSQSPEEKVVFYSETAEVEIGKKKDGTGGAEPIQNLGGKITYMRRYMLMVAFEIVESDYIDRRPAKKGSELELNSASIEKIEAAKTQDKLIKVCKKIKEVKGEKYEVSLRNHYTKRKGELENENV